MNARRHRWRGMQRQRLPHAAAMCWLSCQTPLGLAQEGVTPRQSVVPRELPLTVLDPTLAQGPRDEVRAAELREGEHARDVLVRDRIEVGLVHPFYRGVQAGAEHDFHLDGQTFQRALTREMSPGERIVHELGRYSGGERPRRYGGYAGLPPGMSNTPGTSGPYSEEGRMYENLQRNEDAANFLHAPVTWYRAVVRVRWGGTGEIDSVSLERSSHVDALDREALRIFRSAEARIAWVVPEELLAERSDVSALFVVELGDVATHPGQLGCVDGGPEGGRCAALGRGILRLRVRLFNMWDADNPTYAESDAMRVAVARERARARQSRTDAAVGDAGVVESTNSNE